MRKRYKNTFRNKVLDYMRDMPGAVVLRSDIAFLGEKRQISRVLSALTEDGDLVKLGSGVYVKARKSDYLDRPVICVGFTRACIEALDRLDISWEPSQSFKAYNDGQSQQVPAHFEVRLKSRFRRKLAYGNRTLRIEGMMYAK